MAIEINEVRPDKCDDTLAFARERGVQPEADRVIHALSVAAREDDTWHGAALCHRADDGGRVIQIVIEDGQDELGQRLMDKALLKLQATGAHTCRLLTRDGRPWTGMPWKIGVFDQDA